MPYKEIGGSGGYIYINTTNKQLSNQINRDVRIEAEGGHGTNGGSGGIIILAGGFNIPDEQLSAAGGASTNKNLTDDSGCSNGAAGTTYFITNDNTTRLLVDNKGRPTPKQTVLVAPEATN